MIAWNSQMALDARQYMFFNEVEPEELWRVVDDQDKTFILKFYRIDEGTEALNPGQYVESKHLENDNSYDESAPESGTEWAYVETSVDQVLKHFERTEEITDEVSL
ncbi:MAG: hypothetical protein ABEJ65_02085 [bacterium]